MPAITARVPLRTSLSRFLARPLQDTGDAINISVKRTTVWWLQQPAWTRKYSVNRGRYSVALQTGDPYWRDVNFGTPSVDVQFSSNYEAKTVPGQIYGRPGRGRVVARNVPGGPGIIPRRWTELIAELEQPRMERRLQRAIDAYVRAVL